MKIVLIGYMGSGKTYIGLLLSKLLNYPHFDLDEFIECILKIKINYIFKNFGENYFRKIEKRLLNYFVKNNKSKNWILSLGGGTPCFYNNLKIIKQYSNISFYLKNNYKILFKRLENDNENRPLLNKYKGKELLNFIKNHIKIRNKYYNQADYIIDTENMEFKDIAKYIKNFLLNYDKKF
ncbi:MAG: AAA family ATPase [Candidatus Shikimatogenerans sp. JK-2022]|nr:AAA family ATPase [Candidatus Shikimatogenerans bostrichidophilus]